MVILHKGALVILFALIFMNSKSQETEETIPSAQTPDSVWMLNEVTDFLDKQNSDKGMGSSSPYNTNWIRSYLNEIPFFKERELILLNFRA